MRPLSSDSSAVSNCYITAFTRFVILFVMLYDYLISNISYAKIGRVIRVRSEIVMSQLILIL